MTETLNLRRQAIIKALVTDTFKQQASAELQGALQQIDMQMQQLEFQGKRAISDLEKKGISPAGPELTAQLNQLKAQIEQERQNLFSAKNDMMQKLNMIGQLEAGSEFVQGNVDNFVDVKLGDNLYAKLSSPEIIVKDGIVIEIRQPEA